MFYDVEMIFSTRQFTGIPECIQMAETKRFIVKFQTLSLSISQAISGLPI